MKKRIKKQIAIFFGVLSFVLVVGIVVMFAYAKRVDSDSENKKLSIDFDYFNIFEDKETNDVDDEAVQASDNTEIYNEAVAMGQKVHLAEAADGERVIFTFAGDVLLDENYANMSSHISRGSNIEDTFSANLLDSMRNSDVFMVNNEFTFTERGNPIPNKTFTFRARPANVELLRQIGVDMVSLANNHAYDFGEVSLLDTMETLNTADISYMGAGQNLQEAMKPLYVIANGMKIAIVSATQIERTPVPDTREATPDGAGVLRCMDTTTLLSVIEEAENNSDYTILYIHWGSENHEEIDWLQEEQAPIYVDAGVDLIIGAHPHCLQKIDMISGVPVVYSLGNFWFNSKTVNTGMIQAVFTRNGLESLKFIPCLQSNCRTRQLEGEEKETLLQYMRGISPNVNIDVKGYITQKQM